MKYFKLQSGKEVKFIAQKCVNQNHRNPLQEIQSGDQKQKNEV